MGMNSYAELREAHRWRAPRAREHRRRGVRPAAGGDPAILVTDGREITRTVSFGELSESSNRLANALSAQGSGRATGSL